MGQRAPDGWSSLAKIIHAWRQTAGPDGQRMTLGDLAYEARKYGASAAFDGSALSKALSGERPYDTVLLQALARVLGHDPSELPHYRLAKAREQLDERIQGLETALENYERWIASTGTGTAKAAAQQARRRAKRPPNRGETRNAKEGGR